AFSAVSLRIDNYAEIEAKFGSAAFGQLLGRLVKLLQGMLRAEDALGRTGEALFSVILPGTGAQQAVGVAQRLRQRLESARITHGAEAVSILTSLGVAALGNDNVASVEELLKTSVARLQQAALKAEAQRSGARETLPAPPPPARAPGDVASALHILERASAERPSEVLDRLGPLVKATCARVGIDLQEYLFLLQSR
ncbi:MAG TPA: diguanylate cyclase, partial [Burkholderiales bacterium]|nr:diguanylate cyclase [Burkholderiales bacterium]